MPYKDPEKRKVWAARYYQKNKVYCAAKNADWREMNKESIAVREATWRENNKEKLAVYDAEKYKKNKGHILALKLLHRAEVKERRVNYNRVLREQFYDMYGIKKEGHEHGVCPCCGEDLMAFGTISHNDGSGAQHRRLTRGRIRKMLEDALIVKDTIRFGALCWNCNSGAFKNGGICPHKNTKPPDDGLLVADRNGDSGLGLSHGSPARVLVGVKTQEG